MPVSEGDKVYADPSSNEEFKQTGWGIRLANEGQNQERNLPNSIRLKHTSFFFLSWARLNCFCSFWGWLGFLSFLKGLPRMR